MRFRTWPVVAVALLGLLGLIVVSILAAQRKADIVYGHLASLNAHYRNVEARLQARTQRPAPLRDSRTRLPARYHNASDGGTVPGSWHCAPKASN